MRSLLVLLAIACATPRPDLAAAKRQVEQYVDSGAYDADIAAVASEAAKYLESRSAAGRKLAIVVDLDETAISNVVGLRANDWGWVLAGPCDPDHGPCAIRGWTALARSAPIKPVLELTR